MNIQIVDQDLVQQIEQIAATEQRSPEQIVAEALRLYATQKQKVSGVSFLLSIAGQGRSGERDVSERDEEILAAETDPVRGWHPEPRDANSA
jgi:predicted transcriptional regulator